jgi:DNA-directed RNA polymerase specialized sigma24 family protein
MPRTISVIARTTREIPSDVDDTITTARQLQADGEAKVNKAASMIRAAAKELQRQGWSYRDIGQALDVSGSRVDQLLNAGRRAAAKP